MTNRSRVIPAGRRLGAVIGLAGAAGLASVPPMAGAEGAPPTTGSYTLIARADTAAFEFVESATPAAPGGEVLYATPASAQAVMDSVGRSQGYASAPSPGSFFTTLPGNGNGVLASFGVPVAFPHYPFAVSSDHPVAPVGDAVLGPSRLRAESDDDHSYGDARLGALSNDDPAVAALRARASVAVDPATGARTAAADTRVDGFTTGPLVLGQSSAHAKMTEIPGQQPVKESSFTVGRFTVGGVGLAITDEGIALGPAAPPGVELAAILKSLEQSGVSVEYLPATETATSIDSAGLKITRTATGPVGNTQRQSVIFGRVQASIVTSATGAPGEATLGAIDHATTSEAADVIAPSVPETPSVGTGPSVDTSQSSPVAAGPLVLDTADEGGPLGREPQVAVTAPPAPPRPAVRLVPAGRSWVVRSLDTTGFYAILPFAGLVVVAGLGLVATRALRQGAPKTAAAGASPAVLRLPGRR